MLQPPPPEQNPALSPRAGHDLVATRRKVIQLFIALLEEVELAGADSKGRWTITYPPDPTRWVLTRGELRAWIECHHPGPVPTGLVDAALDYLHGVAESAEAAADLARHCERERAVDNLHDLLVAAGGAR